MPYGYRPQRPGVLDPNDPRKRRLPLTPEEDPYGGIEPNLEVDLPEPVSPLPQSPLTQPASIGAQTGARLPMEQWQTPPRDLTSLRAWYSGAANVPGAPPMPEWGKRTPTYSRLNPPPPKSLEGSPAGGIPSSFGMPKFSSVGQALQGQMAAPLQQAAIQARQGVQVRPTLGRPAPPAPNVPVGERQRYTLAEAERRALQAPSRGQAAGQFAQEAGMGDLNLSRTLPQVARDVGLELGAGALNLGGMAFDAADLATRSLGLLNPSFDPKNPGGFQALRDVSDSIGKASESLLARRTPDYLQRRSQMEQRLAAAPQDVMSQIAAYAASIYDDPSMAEQAIVTNLPQMFPSMAAGKIASLGKAARAVKAARAISATSGVGLTQTAVDAQKSSYDAMKQQYVSQGMSPQQADQLAFQNSLPAFIVGGALGAVGGHTGVEASLFGTGARGMAQRAGRVAAEFATEGAEEVIPQAMTNVQLGRPISQGLGQTIAETMIATAPFAGMAGMGRSDGGATKVPDALQSETGRYGNMVNVGMPRAPLSFVPGVPSRRQGPGFVMREAQQPQPEPSTANRTTSATPSGQPTPRLLPPGDTLPAPPAQPATRVATGAQPARPAPPVTPETATTGEQQVAPGISFRPLTTIGAPGARPVLPLDRVPEQLAMRTMRGPEVMAEVEPELEARRAAGEEVTARDVQRPGTVSAHIAQAINKTSTRVASKLAPAYGLQTTNIDDTVGDVLTNIAREMSEMDNREYTVADIRGAVRTQTGKAAAQVGEEQASLWSRWYENYGKQMGLSNQDHKDLQNLAAGNYGFAFRPDVQAILLGDVGAPYANKEVMQVIREDMARLMNLPPGDYQSLSLTVIPPHTWRNWALTRQLDTLAPEAYRELMEAVERGPRLQELKRSKEQAKPPKAAAPVNAPLRPSVPSGVAPAAPVAPPVTAPVTPRGPSPTTTRYQMQTERGLPRAPLAFQPRSYTEGVRSIEQARADREEARQAQQRLKEGSPFAKAREAELGRIEGRTATPEETASRVSQTTSAKEGASLFPELARQRETASAREAEFVRDNPNLPLTVEDYIKTVPVDLQQKYAKYKALRTKFEKAQQPAPGQPQVRFGKISGLQMRELQRELEFVATNVAAAKAVLSDVVNRAPVKADTVEAMNIKLPKGYVRQGDSFVFREPKAAPKSTGTAQTEAIPDDVRQALATLDSPKGKTSRVRKIVKATFPEIGPKAIFINDNIEQIIAEAEANGKVTKECP